MDGIRGIAIALVLFCHCLIYREESPAGLAAGAAGVTVFFVLSGYLITSLLCREEDQNGTISLGLFYARRAFRLFPALWLYLIVLAALQACGQLHGNPWHDFVSSLLYVRNFIGRGHETSHLWSLSIEEQFYLLWPLVVLSLRRRDVARLIVAVAGIILVTAWRATAERFGLASAGALYIRSDFRFDAPLFGCALAVLMRLTTIRRSTAVSTLSALLLAAVVAWHPASGLASTLVCLSACGLIVSLPSWLSWPPLVWLGRISYGVYLWQQLFLGPSREEPILHVVRQFPALGLVATLAVAIASFALLERPLIELKDRRLHSRPQTRCPAQIAMETTSSLPVIAGETS